MMNTFQKRAITIITAVALMVSAFCQTGVTAHAEETAAAAEVQSLIITEAYIDDISRPEWIPTGASTFDPFEYVEIYNPAESPVNFTQGYGLYHYRNSAKTEYSLPLYGQTGDVIIPAKSSIVLWGFWATKYAGASANQIPTISDFRQAFNIAESVGIYQVNTNSCSGFYNTYNANFRIKDTGGNLICEAAYTPAADSADSKSIDFRMPSEGTGMTVYKQKAVPSPGVVWEEQYTPPMVAKAPVIGSISASDTYTSGEPFTVSAMISDAQSASINIKQSDSTPYQRFSMVNQGDGTFSAAIPRTKLWGEDIQWYIEAYNDTKTAKSEEKISRIQYPYDPAKQPQVLMTELKTEDTGYNYLEYFNNSDEPINFVYYSVFYEYPSGLSYKYWTFDTNALYIDPGKTLVVWINDDAKTVADFNSHYNVQLEENKSIIKVDYSGMSPDVERTIKLGNIYENPIVLATYHEDELDDTAKISSIHYTYSRDNAIRMVKADTASAPTPGTVEDWQVPAVRVEFDKYGGHSDAESSMVLKPMEEIPAAIKEGEALNVAFDCYDTSTGVNTIETFYKFDEETEYKVKMEKRQRIANQFITSIPASEFLGHKKVIFYIRAYNAFRHFDTEAYEVVIKPGIDMDGITLNVSDNQLVSGAADIIAEAGSGMMVSSIQVDGEDQSLMPMPVNGTYFSFKAGSLTSYYKNAITVEDTVVKLLSSWAKVDQQAAHIDNSSLSRKANGDYEVTVTLRAGSQGSPFEAVADHAAFTMSNMALYLPDGTFIYPDNGIDYDTAYTIGSSLTSMSLDVHFTIPVDKIKSRGIRLDTTKLQDGTHVVTAWADSSSRNVEIVVDNAGPEADLGIEEGATLGSGDVISPQVQDQGSGIDAAKTVVSLDDVEIQLPYTISSLELENGSHILKASYSDYAGHTTQKTVSFNTDFTVPNASINEVVQDKSRSANLSVQVEGAVDSKVTVEFLEGKKFSLEQNNIRMSSGAGDDPLMHGGTGSVSTSSNTELPYQLFQIQTGELEDEALIEAVWKGSSEAPGTLQLFVLNVAKNQWEPAAAVNQGQIKASFRAKDHVKAGKAIMLVQSRSEGIYPSARADGAPESFSGASGENGGSPAWDGTGVPANYDFSFAWISDPQYYVESWPDHYTNMNRWIVENRDKYNIRYTLNTGDLIDEWDRDNQWQITDGAQRILEDADMPNGVLAGNHDVASGNEEYGSYWKYFGEERYQGNSYYGGSYRNNLGHYDLISAGGQDFIILYMSWDVYQPEVAWMNQVLAQYPNRKAVIALHRYLQQGGELDYTGELLQKEVVAKNPNVFAVLNGHYFGAAIKIDGYDDNGDGVKERKVYQICTDYQGAAEGGLQYLKMLYFDLEHNKIYMNAYSPYLKDFNYFDNPKLDSYDVGKVASSQDIYELDVPFDTETKTLETTSMDISVYTNRSIGKQENVSGKVGRVWEGLAPDTKYWWYADITNENGDVLRTALTGVRTLGDGSTVIISPGTPTGGGTSSGGKTEPVGIMINDKTETAAASATTEVDGQTVTTITLDAGKIAEMLEKEVNNAVITIPFSADTDVAMGQLTGQTVKDMQNKEAVIELKTGNVIYTLPAALINIDSISSQLGTQGELKDIAVNIRISAVSKETAGKVENIAKENNLQVMAGPVEFEITCTNGNSTVEIVRFNGYVERMVALSEAVDPQEIVTGIVLNPDGSFSPVPTSIIVMDGKVYAKIRSLTNSTYSVVTHSISFKDVQSHWAKEAVNEMGSRLILSGTGDGRFEPDKKITRAEFAAMVVRALGLMRPGTGKDLFLDVSKDAWYYDAVSIASEYGILFGYGNGKFGPGEQITREQAMTIIARAMKITGLKAEFKAGEVEAVLAGFGDSGLASEWARESMAACVKTDTVLGGNGNLLSPKNAITRAEVAVIIQRLLQKSGLI